MFVLQNMAKMLHCWFSRDFLCLQVQWILIAGPDSGRTDNTQLNFSGQKCLSKKNHLMKEAPRGLTKQTIFFKKWILLDMV